MIQIRPSQERGVAEHGWLRSLHSFSFADYQNPARMQFGNLRVINEDRVAPGRGFGMHSHRDMEIVSYVLDGELAHEDSLGNGAAGGANGGASSGILRHGDVQRISAGTGLTHSEYNHTVEHTTHFLQMWIFPARDGLPPSYEQQHFDDASKRGQLCLIVSPDGREGSLTIHANASIHAGLFDGDERAEMPIAPQRLVYVHLVRGHLQVNGHALASGDAAELQGEAELRLSHGRNAEVLVFDLAP